MRKVRVVAVAAGVAGVLLFAAPASAHVTVSAQDARQGGFTRVAFRVPTESDTLSTTKLEVHLPESSPIASVSTMPVPGWTVAASKTKLAQPVKTDDGEVTEQVSTITWTGHGSEGKIPPGAFQDFGLSVQVPGKAGDTLTFKALQTYSDGEVVRWIGPESSDNPAPTVKVQNANAEAAAPAATPAPATPASAQTSDSAGSDTVAIVALIVGALGLLAGARPSSPAADPPPSARRDLTARLSGRARARRQGVPRRARARRAARRRLSSAARRR
jgi:uncharacterized protein